MSSFLFGQLSSSQAPAAPSPDLRVVDVQTLQQARQSVESDNAFLADRTAKADLVNELAAAEADPVPTTQKSKMDSLLEGLLGIIPLEGLAVWVIATEAFSKIEPAVTSNGDKAATVNVSDPGAIQVAIVLAMLVAAVSFFIGRRTSKDKSSTPKHAALVVLPTAAVFLWAYVVNPSVLRTAMGHQAVDTRWIAAVAAACVVVMVAAAVGLSKAQPGNGVPVQPAPAA